MSLQRITKGFGRARLVTPSPRMLGEVCYDANGAIVPCTGMGGLCYDDDGNVVDCVPSTGGAAMSLGPQPQSDTPPDDINAKVQGAKNELLTVIYVTSAVVTGVVGAGVGYLAGRSGKSAAIGGGVGAAVGAGGAALWLAVAHDKVDQAMADAKAKASTTTSGT